MQAQPLICVQDVEATSRWYQQLLGCKSAHGGPEYEMLVWDNQLVLQLHRWDVGHHHGPIGDPALKPYGNGVLLWFELEDFDAAMTRLAQLKADILKPRHRNPPEGYGGPNIGNVGCAIPTVTRWCSPALSAPQGMVGNRVTINERPLRPANKR